MTEDFLKTLVPSILASYQKAYGLRDVPISIDYLRPMIEERGWVDKIIWEEYFFASQHIVAQVEFFQAEMGVYLGLGDYARVQFSSDLNFCWRRFAICKEMYHAIIDQNGARRITSIDDLLKLSEMLISGTSAAVQAFSPFETENVAEILALETLFPFELRSRFVERYRDGGISDHQLALRFRIPEEYARMGMYPTYYEAIREIRAGTLVDF